MSRPARIVAPLLVSVALGLTACGYSGSHASQVRQWAQQNSYNENARQVVSDADHALLAAAHGTALELRTVCGGLSSDAGTLYSSLDTPDHALTNQVAASMQDFFDAAEKCAVTHSTTSARASEAVAQMRKGLAELAKADATFRRFGVHAPTVSS